MEISDLFSSITLARKKSWSNSLVCTDVAGLNYYDRKKEVRQNSEKKWNFFFSSTLRHSFKLCKFSSSSRMHCCQLGCGRRIRRRKRRRERFRETTCWPTWRNRPKSILTKKTWSPSRARREVRTCLLIVKMERWLCEAQNTVFLSSDKNINIRENWVIQACELWEGGLSDFGDVVE